MQKAVNEMTLEARLKLQDVEIESFGAINYVNGVAKALAKKMLSGTIQEYVIVHDTDMDGTVGGALMHRIFQRFLDVQHAHLPSVAHGLRVCPLTSGRDFEEGIETFIASWPQDVERVIVIVDHAIRPKLFQQLQAYGSLFLMDHHTPTKELDTVLDWEKMEFVITESSCSTMKAYQLSLALIDQLLDADYSQLKGNEEWNDALMVSLETTRKTFCTVEYCVLVALTDYEDRYQYKGLDNLHGEARQTEQASRSLDAWFRSNTDSSDRIRQLILTHPEVSVDDEIFRWILEGEGIFKMKEEMVKLVMKSHGKQVVWNFPVNQEYVGYRIMTYLHADLINRLSERTLDEHPEVDAVAVFRISRGRVKCSLRSRSQGCLNVRQLAEYFGGGGHLTASGFTVGLKAFSELLQDTVNIDTV